MTDGQHMRAEILESKEVLERLNASGQLADLPHLLGVQRSILAVAHGSSLHALEIAAASLAMRGIDLECMTPQMLQQRLDATKQHSMAVFMSQSGQTVATLEAMSRSLESGVPCLWVTNQDQMDVPEHELLMHVPLRAGDEHAVCATKTVIASLCTLDMLSRPADRRDASAQQWLDLAQQIPQLAGSVIGSYVKPRHIWVLADGFLQPVAREVALKFMEAALIPATALASEDALHGPVVAMQSDDLLISLDGHAIEAFHESVYARTSQAMPMINLAEYEMPLSGMQLAAGRLIHAQQAVLTLALLWGQDPDMPPGLSKITNPDL